jgi:beta-carotene 3-hydroxylase
MIRFALIFVVTFIGMELFSYLAHRFVYHGWGWPIHKSHHSARKGVFERNDIFPALFATITAAFMIYALSEAGSLELTAVATGITSYGMVYFAIHDLYVHRRVRRFPVRIPFLRRLKQAHVVHHRYGGEPYGLLFFAHPGKMAVEKIDEDGPV